MTKKNLDIERLSYSVQESAAKLGVSARTVHTCIKDGDLACLRIGTRVLIPADALPEFIEQRTQKREDVA